MILVGRIVVGGVVFADGVTLSGVLVYRGITFPQPPSFATLAKILKIAALCLYLFSAFTALTLSIDVAVAILSPGIGGSLATVQRILAWNIPDLLIGIGCVLAAECLNWVGDKVLQRQVEVLRRDRLSGAFSVPLTPD